MKIAILLLAAAVAPAWAGSMAVSPVRIELSNATRTAVVTVENQSEVSRLYQLEVDKWTQPDGEDVYAPAKDLIAVPPVFKLEPGRKQIVRLGLQASQGARELAYRLFVNELPAAAAAPDGAPSVQTLLRIGIPIFVPPLVKGPAPRLIWTPQTGPAGVTAFTIENPGAAHVQVGLVKLDGGAEIAAGIYVLAGEKRVWTLPQPVLLRADGWKLEAKTDQGTLVFEPLKPGA